ncbi:MAG: LysM peptidoglycan-binding domain-containing protein [Pseudomonadota bacterium]
MKPSRIAGPALATVVCVMATNGALANAHRDPVHTDHPGAPPVTPVEQPAVLQAAPAFDLLDQVAAGLVLPDTPERRTQQQYEWYRKHPTYLDRVFTRAERYLPYIVEQINARGMPLDLALLPVVESAFDPFAYSHGRAAGLWQFIPGTGRLYGLEQDWWYDGRRDVIDSTRAALDYLQALHTKTGNDWLLAVAAYNSGEGRVLSAMRKNRRKGLPTDFWHLSLPRETRSYVPKLLAIGRIVKRRYEHPFALPDIDPAPYFSTVDVDGQIDIALAARMAGTTVDDIYRLNPGFNRWATRPEGPHRLAIPVDAAPAFRDALATTPADQRVRWTRYRIREGDVLGKIARQHGTTVEVLETANQLNGSAIRAGRYLMIPSASGAAADYSLSAPGRQQARLDRTDGQRYTVRVGDSLWTIGRRFGVSARSLARWNGMAPGDTLSVGRELVVRTARTVAGTTTPPGTQRRIAYIVRRGDSLSTISSRFRVSVTQLVNWNQLDRKRYLQPGQRLVMYVDVTQQSGG